MAKDHDPRILVGDCRQQLKKLDDNSVDAIVTDPPYELGFMGKRWDASGVAYDVDLWAQCLRVLKPGGHLLAFGGTRTYHRMAVAIEDAGFEVRDSIHWLYGSGFPKSLNVQTATDTDQWAGWGTALKPAHEPIVLARKPLAGTVAGNVLKHGTGALNIEGSRVGLGNERPPTGSGNHSEFLAQGGGGLGTKASGNATPSSGRWPANLVLDDTVAELHPEWANYFYCAKPSKRERNAGLDQLPAKSGGQATGRQDGSAGLASPRAGAGRTGDSRNHHPTVKPVTLMRWLVRLVTPPGGVVLDPFLGSGTTAVAATLEGFEWKGCELTEEYLPIIKGRIKWAEKERDKTLPTLFDEESA